MVSVNDSADQDGPFAWSALTDPVAYKKVMEKLHQFETMEETVIHAAGSHLIEVQQLSKDARNRLAAIQQDDIDSPMSFRLTGPERGICSAPRLEGRRQWLACPPELSRY